MTSFHVVPDPMFTTSSQHTQKHTHRERETTIDRTITFCVCCELVVQTIACKMLNACCYDWFLCWFFNMRSYIDASTADRPTLNWCTRNLTRWRTKIQTYVHLNEFRIMNICALKIFFNNFLYPFLAALLNFDSFFYLNLSC